MSENLNDDLVFTPLQYDNINLNRQIILPLPLGYPPYGYGPNIYPYPPIIGPYSPFGPGYPQNQGGYYPGNNKNWNYKNKNKNSKNSKREENILAKDLINNDENITVKEYTLNSQRDIFTIPLLSLTIPESIDDYTTEIIGKIAEKDIFSKVPCIKYRTINYKLYLEVLFPQSLNNNLKEKLKELSFLAANDALNTISLERNDSTLSNPLNHYSELTDSIPLILKEFNHLFRARQDKFYQLKDLSSNISFSIRNEKVTSPWTMYL